MYRFLVALQGLCLFVFLLIGGINIQCVTQWINCRFRSQGFGTKSQEPANILPKKPQQFSELLSEDHNTGFDFCYHLISVLKSLSAIPIFPPFILYSETCLHNYICTYCNTNVLFQDDSEEKTHFNTYWILPMVFTYHFLMMPPLPESLLWVQVIHIIIK